MLPHDVRGQAPARVPMIGQLSASEQKRLTAMLAKVLST
jgi:hypothetical protein